MATLALRLISWGQVFLGVPHFGSCPNSQLSCPFEPSYTFETCWVLFAGLICWGQFILIRGVTENICICLGFIRESNWIFHQVEASLFQLKVTFTKVEFGVKSWLSMLWIKCFIDSRIVAKVEIGDYWSGRLQSYSALHHPIIPTPESGSLWPLLIDLALDVIRAPILIYELEPLAPSFLQHLIHSLLNLF